MKKLILCTLAALPLVAHADSCSLSKSKYTSLASVQANGQGFEKKSNYDDVMGWCSNWITDLQQVRWSASLEASTGNMEGAATQLKNALDEKAGEVATVFPNPAPHAADAIVVSANIVEEVFAQSLTLPQRLRVQVRYLMADSVYSLIEDAFNNLDRNYYSDVLNHCGYGHHDCYRDIGSGSFLPREYYDGMRRLAVKILDLQESLAHYQASDILELGVSHAVSIGARDILMNSVVRRSMACEIGQLDFTAKQIERFLSCEGSSVNRPTQVRIVRDLLEKAKEGLRNTRCRNR